MSFRKIFIPVVLGAALLTGGCNAKTPTAAAAPTTTVSASAEAAMPAMASAMPSATPSVCPTANTTAFAKTKFTVHAGLAAGSFHRYLYKPMKAGAFTTGSTAHKVLTVAKAGGTALFIKHEFGLMADDIQASPALCSTLGVPIRALSATLDAGMAKLKGGDTSGLEDVQTSLTSIETGSAKAGVPVTETDGGSASTNASMGSTMTGSTGN